MRRLCVCVVRINRVLSILSSSLCRINRFIRGSLAGPKGKDMGRIMRDVLIIMGFLRMICLMGRERSLLKNIALLGILLPGFCRGKESSIMRESFSKGHIWTGRRWREDCQVMRLLTQEALKMGFIQAKAF